MLKFIVISALVIIIVVVAVLMLWEEYEKRHDEQVLATRVMQACHEIGTPVTALQIHTHIQEKHKFMCAMGDVRVLLECMAAEGTLTRGRDYRENHAGRMVHMTAYTLTPRHAAGFQ